MPWYRFDGSRDKGNASGRILVKDINGDDRQVTKNQTIELAAGVFNRLDRHNVMTPVADDQGHPAPLIGEPSLPAPNKNMWPQVRQFKDWTLEIPMNEDQMPHGEVKITTLKLPSPRFIVGIAAFAVGSVDAENGSMSSLCVGIVPEGVAWADAVDTNNGLPFVGAYLNKDLEVGGDRIAVCTEGLSRVSQGNPFGPNVIPNDTLDGIDATEPPDSIDVYLSASSGFDFDMVFTLEWFEIVIY